MLSTLVLLALAALVGPSAHAQDRGTSRRSRLELSLDHGYGFGSEGQYLEVAADLRVYSPEGLGVALRTGAALQGFSNALALEIGVAARFDLLAAEHIGLQLALALGPSLAAGPFDGGNVLAYGGWSVLSLDFWFRNFFVGAGVSGHALISERHDQQVDPRDIAAPRGGAPILSLTPIIRIGGDWGL